MEWSQMQEACSEWTHTDSDEAEDSEEGQSAPEETESRAARAAIEKLTIAAMEEELARFVCEAWGRAGNEGDEVKDQICNTIAVSHIVRTMEKTLLRHLTEEGKGRWDAENMVEERINQLINDAMDKAEAQSRGGNGVCEVDSGSGGHEEEAWLEQDET